MRQHIVRVQVARMDANIIVSLHNYCCSRLRPIRKPIFPRRCWPATFVFVNFINRVFRSRVNALVQHCRIGLLFAVYEEPIVEGNISDPCLTDNDRWTKRPR